MCSARPSPTPLLAFTFSTSAIRRLAQCDEAEEERRGLGDSRLLSATNHGRDERIDVQTVDHLSSFMSASVWIRPVEQHVDERVDVQAVDHAVEVHIACGTGDYGNLPNVQGLIE